MPGRVVKLVIPEGSDDVAVSTVIALITEGNAAEQEDVGPLAADSLGPAESTKHAPVPKAPPVAKSPELRTSRSDLIDVSPLARRIAEAKGMDLSDVTGSGPNGRVTRADLRLEQRLVTPPITPAATPASPQMDEKIPPPAGVPVETIKLSSMRRTIARRLSQSNQTVPHFYLTARCNLDPLLELRVGLNAGLAARGLKLSVNDMLIKALALALGEVPKANVQFGGDELHNFGRADISMAVAIDGGLITPVIRDAGALSLSAISSASKALVQKARAGKLAREDHEGGTASISNLGMFGIDEMFPVINPPQGLILGIGQPQGTCLESRRSTWHSPRSSRDRSLRS